MKQAVEANYIVDLCRLEKSRADAFDEKKAADFFSSVSLEIVSLGHRPRLGEDRCDQHVNVFSYDICCLCILVCFKVKVRSHLCSLPISCSSMSSIDLDSLKPGLFSVL